MECCRLYIECHMDIEFPGKYTQANSEWTYPPKRKHFLSTYSTVSGLGPTLYVRRVCVCVCLTSMKRKHGKMEWLSYCFFFYSSRMFAVKTPTFACWQLWLSQPSSAVPSLAFPLPPTVPVWMRCLSSSWFENWTARLLDIICQYGKEWVSKQ